MGIEIPESLQWVAKYILGAGDWPEGDETAMRRVADGWTGMANALDTVDDTAAAALNAALSALSAGETHDAIAVYRDKLLSGDEAAFTAIRKWCEKQAEILEDGANDIEHTKLVIIGTMIVAAVEIGAAIATSWTGVGAAAGVAARVAAQVAVRVAIRQLIARMLTRGAAKAMARMALRGAFFEALEEGGIDAAARVIQVAKGDRSMEDFGWYDLGLATFGGAVGGLVGGGLGGPLEGLGDAATKPVSKFVTNAVTGTGTELAADLSAQVAATGLNSAITGEDFNLDIGVDTFTSAGAGGLQTAVESGSHNSNDGPAPDVPDLGDVPGNTDTPAGTGDPGSSDTGTPGDTGDPGSGDPGSTTPASTTPSTPSTPGEDTSTTPSSSTPSPSDTGTPAGPGNSTTPDSSPTSPADTDAPTSPSGSNTPTGTDTPSSPDSGSPGGNSTDAGTPGDNSPGSQHPGQSTPDAGTPGDTGPSQPGSPTPSGTPTEETPSAPTNPGDTGNPAAAPTNPATTPSSPGDSSPTSGAPNDSSTSSPSTPAASPTSPPGTESPTAPGDSNPSSSPTGTDTPSSPSGSPPSSNPAGTETPAAPGNATPANPADSSPSSPGNATPSSPTDNSSSNPSTPGAPSSPGSAPTNDQSGQPTSTLPSNPAPSSLDLPPADTPTTTLTDSAPVGSTPTDSTPLGSTPSDSTPAQPSPTIPTTPGTTTSTGDQSSTTSPGNTTTSVPSSSPGTTPPVSTTGTPSTPNVQTPTDRQPQSTDTTTAGAAPGATLAANPATATPAPAATTPATPAPPATPVSAAVPSTAAPTIAAPATPATPSHSQPAAPPRTPTHSSPSPASQATPPTPPVSRSHAPADSTTAMPTAPTGPTTNTSAPVDTPTTHNGTPTPSTPSVPPTDPPSQSPTSNPTIEPALTPQDLDNADRARQARESLRPLTPAGNQTLRVTPSTGRPYLTADYPDALVQPVQVVRVTAAVTASPTTPPTAIHTITDRTQLATDLTFNQGSQFPFGGWLMVDVVPTTDPTTADLTFDATTTPTLTDIANTIRTHLGLPPRADPALTPEDVIRIGSDIDRANLSRATHPSWADQHTPATTPPTDTDPNTDPESDPNTPTDPNTPDDVDLDAIHNQYAEQTPAGVSHHRGDPTMGDLPHRVPADPDHFTADTHITPDGYARIGDHTLTPQQYADLLRRSGWDGVTPIRLIGCDAATNGFARQLARELGVDVLAPTHAAWTDTNGNIFSSSPITNPDGTRSPRVPPDGQWQTHHPTGTTTPAGTTSTPPGSAPPKQIDADSAVDRGRGRPPGTTAPATAAGPEHTPTPAGDPRPPGVPTPQDGSYRHPLDRAADRVNDARAKLAQAEAAARADGSDKNHQAVTAARQELANAVTQHEQVRLINDRAPGQPISKYVRDNYYAYNEQEGDYRRRSTGDPDAPRIWRDDQGNFFLDSDTPTNKHKYAQPEPPPVDFAPDAHNPDARERMGRARDEAGDKRDTAERTKKAAESALESAQDAVKAAEKALESAKRSGDTDQIDARQTELDARQTEHSDRKAEYEQADAEWKPLHADANRFGEAWGDIAADMAMLDQAGQERATLERLDSEGKWVPVTEETIDARLERGADGFPRGRSGEFDAVYRMRMEDGSTRVEFVEAKGPRGSYGTRKVDGVNEEQGTPKYFENMRTVDPNQKAIDRAMRSAGQSYTYSSVFARVNDDGTFGGYWRRPFDLTS